MSNHARLTHILCEFSEWCRVKALYRKLPPEGIASSVVGVVVTSMGTVKETFAVSEEVWKVC